MRTIVKLLSPLLLSAGVSGCALPYYWQAVGGQISLMRKRVPIEEAIERETDPARQARLNAVLELRRFAAAELGLDHGGSYSSYVELERDYIVWNVIAAGRFSVDAEEWCFPVAGCVSYRGYFDREDALAFERRLIDRGLDTWSGGSGAYSTLGYFDDPVLSTMIAGSEVDLAALLFHELAHQRVYISGDSELSEAFASAVEAYGVATLLTSRGDDAALAAYRARLDRAREFSGFVAAQRAMLGEIYSQPLPTDELLQRKIAAFERIRADYEVLKRSWGGLSEYDGWFDGELNNARLAAIATYRRWLPGLSWRLQDIGHEAFYADIEALAELDPEARTTRLEQWNAAASALARKSH